MRIITISREFGSGGRELGKKLAEKLGYDYYDKEIITAIAKNMGMDESYVEKALETKEFRNIPLHYRCSFGAGGMTYPLAQTEMLLEQKKVIEAIAENGKDIVIVGRNADAILANYHPFNIFVCANMQTKIERCKKYAKKSDPKTDKGYEKKIKEIDKNRATTRNLFTSSKWGDYSQYHVVLNSSYWNMDDLVKTSVNMINTWFERKEK